jgi:hypothetical protein
MCPNAFINKPKPPTEPELTAALGAAKAVWDQILTRLDQDLGVDGREWKCHSPKWGWSLRVKRKERTIIWFSPFDGRFEVSFILGDRAMCAARAIRLPKRVLDVMKSAPKYPEGTGIRLEVKSARDIAALMKLAAIKLAH